MAEERQPTDQEIEIAIHVAAIALLGMLDDVGANDVVTIISTAMEAFTTEDVEKGKEWLAKLAKAAHEVKDEIMLARIEWPDTIN